MSYKHYVDMLTVPWGEEPVDPSHRSRLKRIEIRKEKVMTNLHTQNQWPFQEPKLEVPTIRPM